MAKDMDTKVDMARNCVSVAVDLAERSGVDVAVDTPSNTTRNSQTTIVSVAVLITSFWNGSPCGVKHCGTPSSSNKTNKKQREKKKMEKKKTEKEEKIQK